jgi:uncharacterized protein (TIGR02118 family)
MNEESATDPVTLYVSYVGPADARFDQAYYVEQHLPMVMRAWGPYGLQGLAAFFPAKPADGTIAICECRFRDEASVRHSLASPETAGVMADLPRFTDLAARRVRAAPV